LVDRDRGADPKLRGELPFFRDLSAAGLDADQRPPYDDPGPAETPPDGGRDSTDGILGKSYGTLHCSCPWPHAA